MVTSAIFESGVHTCLMVISVPSTFDPTEPAHPRLTDNTRKVLLEAMEKFNAFEPVWIIDKDGFAWQRNQLIFIPTPAEFSVGPVVPRADSPPPEPQQPRVTRQFRPAFAPYVHVTRSSWETNQTTGEPVDIF